MNVSIGKPFGAHIIKMVGCLKFPEGVQHRGIIGGVNFIGNGINVFGVASPGVDLDAFCPPEDKAKHKTMMGINSNSKIVMFVSRNGR